MGWSPPNRLVEQAVEWRARRITDPVERLAFLRRNAPVFEPSLRARHLRGLRLCGVVMIPLLLLFVPRPSVSNVGAADVAHPVRGPRITKSSLPTVWLVETKDGCEMYSNGLRVETRLETTGDARSYSVYSASAENSRPLDNGTEPVGIVFHSTESLQAPFEVDQNRNLQRIGEGLLQFIRNHRSYNYVVDRFGRVWRILPDSTKANHAGYSVWSSSDRAWVNLNGSFLGVSLEARTAEPGGDPSDVRTTPAQIHSARVLTEMLRAKYRIPAENCVTHAQVSVNPDNMRIGYHSDWASGFPFEDLGLGDNYRLPVAGLYTFGFDYDSTYLNRAGAPLREGLSLADRRLQIEATKRGLSTSAWRKRLQRQYRQLIATRRHAGFQEGNDTNER